MEGLLPIWKEIGMTSHDVVYKLRKILQTKKIGHSGTLDPDVDGVLPIAIGKATKTIEYMMDSEKVYTGEITLGFSTTTEDRSGEIVDRKAVLEPITEEQIDGILNSFLGDIKQTPPMYSAVKVNGRRLYEYAREGKEVERPSRIARIDSFERTSSPEVNDEEHTVRFTFEVHCGKGTYVRTLAVDVGKALGYPAHMSQLTRESSGGFTRKQAFTLEEVKELMASGKIGEELFPLESALEHFPKHELTEDEYRIVKDGARLDREQYFSESDEKMVFMYKGKAVAIYGIHPTKDQVIKPIKVLRNEL
ncbi:tRNA pseudouridine(55) synthase TruB [Alkalibacterium olivapovliticus]|uniref:tRNA pseudouridine synthase B n=1 Tax=Alkalibacterium olivapovliticus TaxID=99907 RepID=A0A2T0WBN6_9LACT|nr:tRNA pseudouridine(55) synthase TruB [Alkalibacterium olivapovliticus]PRY84129.1 tRNA pseudouridine55 synthase [Alkalibacterium olivapovliticus]